MHFINRRYPGILFKIDILLLMALGGGSGEWTSELVSLNVTLLGKKQDHLYSRSKKYVKSQCNMTERV